MRSELLNHLITSEFPFPIAYSFRRMRDEKDSRELACALFQTLLESLGLVLIADHLASEEREAGLGQDLGRVFESPPSVGVWWIDAD